MTGPITTSSHEKPWPFAWISNAWTGGVGRQYPPLLMLSHRNNNQSSNGKTKFLKCALSSLVGGILIASLVLALQMHRNYLHLYDDASSASGSSPYVQRRSSTVHHSSHHHHHNNMNNNPVQQALSQWNLNLSPILTSPSDDDSSLINTTSKVQYPVEDPIPNPSFVPDGTNTFSSCLLVMDDNHRLTEWLAYHYHVLPLRYMVVAIDPRSRTSPTFLFNHWRRLGMTIFEWTDKDFWTSNERKLAPLNSSATLQTKRDRHRGRQKFFYRKCLIYMKEMNRTWVALHDSDEYLLYNHPSGEKFERYMKNLEQRVSNRQQFEQNQDGAHQKKSVKFEVLHPSQPPPATEVEGGMIHYIRQEQAAGLSYYQSPCIGIPRSSFGAVESTTKERFHEVPDGIDANQLDTLRYRKHARRNDFIKNALGKVIIDVSRVDMKNTPRFTSLHRPIKELCSAPWHNDWAAGLRINHYLGSWDSYSFRDDSRKGFERSMEQWEYKSSTNSEMTDDSIRAWTKGFVQTHGIAKVQDILQHAGLPKSYRNPNDEQWHLLPEILEKVLKTNETVANDNKLVAFDAWVRQKYKDHPLRRGAFKNS